MRLAHHVWRLAPLAAGGPAPFSLCFVPCQSDSACDSGLQCNVGSEISYCNAPLTDMCPTSNGRCDEPMPMGTGLCAPGYDTAECMGAP